MVDENSPEPAVWADHRDDTSENSIKLYAESKKKLILVPRRWLNDSEVEASQNLLK